ncbi:MAG TPA: tetratricopeptide repeat protein [Oligoflexia bacterium]|nr:tetratricopeptide repeat protein [Oligoflexia bacterium]
MHRICSAKTFAALLILLLSAAAFLNIAAAENNEASSLAFRANAAYSEGKYARAADLYRQAIALGINNGHMHYNLANAFYRLGRYGAAIASYRRALAQMPADPDVLSNLALARSHAVDRIEDEPRGLRYLLERMLFLRTHLSTYGLRWCFAVSYLLFWALAALHPLIVLRRRGLVMGTLACLTLYFALLVFGAREDRSGRPVFALTEAACQLKPAVVVVPEVPVRSGNSDNFQVVFQLHDGAEVEAGEKRGDWLEIMLPESRRGWVKHSHVEII